MNIIDNVNKVYVLNQTRGMPRSVDGKYIVKMSRFKNGWCIYEIQGRNDINGVFFKGPFPTKKNAIEQLEIILISLTEKKESRYEQNHL